MKKKMIVASLAISAVVAALPLSAARAQTPAELKNVLEKSEKITCGRKNPILTIKGQLQVPDKVELEIKAGVSVEALPLDVEAPVVRLSVEGKLVISGRDNNPVLVRGWFDKMSVEILAKGRAEFENTVFKDMDISVEGGPEGGVLIMTNCILRNVTIRVNGKNGGEVRITNCTFEGNKFEEALSVMRYGKGPALVVDKCKFRKNARGAILLDASEAVKSGRPPIEIKNCDFVDNGEFNIKLHDSKDLTLGTNWWGVKQAEEAMKTIVVIPKDDRPGRIHFQGRGDKAVASGPVAKGASPDGMKHPLENKDPGILPPNMKIRWVDRKSGAAGSAAGKGKKKGGEDLVPDLDTDL